MATPEHNPPRGNLNVELRELGLTGDRRTFTPGQVIFAAGDAGDGFYVVEAGRVRISAVVGQNEPRILAMIGPGDYFGEMAVLDDATRSATATAEIDTSTRFLARDQLLQLLERRPQLALNLIREFSIRIRALNHKYVDEIIQAERLAAVGRFASTIVHDFKNPLTVISLAAELAAMDGASPALRQNAQQRIAHQVSRMNNMLLELLDFTQPSGQRPNLRPIGFPAFMQPLAEELAQEMTDRRVAVVLQNPAPAVDVRIEPQRLSRLFYNLFNNAADEMPGGGSIFVRFSASDAELRIEVQDTGKGLAPEIVPSLFQPFATHGKKTGTGLGLSICRKIVEDHGGKIWAENTPGQGATFVFTLPIGAAAPAPPVAASDGATA